MLQDNVVDLEFVNCGERRRGCKGEGVLCVEGVRELFSFTFEMHGKKKM